MYAVIKFIGQSDHTIVPTEQIPRLDLPFRKNKKYKVRCAEGGTKDAVIAFIEDTEDAAKDRLKTQRPRFYPNSLLHSASETEQLVNNTKAAAEKFAQQAEETHNILTEKLAQLAAARKTDRNCEQIDEMTDLNEKRKEKETVQTEDSEPEQKEMSPKKKGKKRKRSSRKENEKPSDTKNDETVIVRSADEAKNAKVDKNSDRAAKMLDVDEGKETKTGKAATSHKDKNDDENKDTVDCEERNEQLNNKVNVEPPVDAASEKNGAKGKRKVEDLQSLQSKKQKKTNTSGLNSDKSCNDESAELTGIDLVDQQTEKIRLLKKTKLKQTFDEMRQNIADGSLLGVESLEMNESNETALDTSQDSDIGTNQNEAVKIAAATDADKSSEKLQKKVNSVTAIASISEHEKKVNKKQNDGSGSGKKRYHNEKKKEKSRKSSSRRRRSSNNDADLTEAVIQLKEQFTKAQEENEKFKAAVLKSLATIEENWMQTKSAHQEMVNRDAEFTRSMRIDDINNVPAVGFIRTIDKVQMIHCGEDVWVPMLTYKNAVSNARSDAMFVKNMALAIFGHEALTTSSITGAGSNRNKGIPVKPSLDPVKKLAVRSIFGFFLREHRRYSQNKIDDEIEEYIPYIRSKMSDLTRVPKPKKPRVSDGKRPEKESGKENGQSSVEKRQAEGKKSTVIDSRKDGRSKSSGESSDSDESFDSNASDESSSSDKSEGSCKSTSEKIPSKNK